MADLDQVVRDARAAGEEDHRAVAAQGVVAGVGAFEEAGGEEAGEDGGGEEEGLVRGGGGEVVEFARHAGAGGGDEGDGCWG